MNLDKIFASNPGADVVYVVNDMPFLKRTHADNHSRTTGKPVETHARPVAVEPTAPEGGQEPTAPEGGQEPTAPEGGQDPTAPEGGQEPTAPKGAQEAPALTPKKGGKRK